MAKIPFIPNYLRKGHKVNNVAEAQYRKVRPRVVYTNMGNSFRWRIMVEDEQRQTGTAPTQKAARVAASAALVYWLEQYAK